VAVGVKPQWATQLFSASHAMSGTALGCRFIREKKGVTFALVISLAMKMVDELAQRSAE
jgi:hypothetical protein